MIDFIIKIIFGVLFLIIITPLGIFIRMFGIDFLERRINSKSSSYWKKHAAILKQD